MPRSQAVASNDDGDSPIRVSVSPGALRRLFFGAGAIGGSVGLTWIAETGLDGGMLKQAWGSLQVASPPISMMCVVLFCLVWVTWGRDREEHKQRTNDFISTLNRYADMVEKAEKRAARRRRRR